MPPRAKSYERIIVEFDGASRYESNGNAGCGWVIYDGKGFKRDLVAEGKEHLGANVSKNQAEYRGLYAALRYLSKKNIGCDGLYIRGDSQIVIQQLRGNSKVRSDNIRECYNDVQLMLEQVDHKYVKYSHIDREQNENARKIANEAVKKPKGKRRG